MRNVLTIIVTIVVIGGLMLGLWCLSGQAETLRLQTQTNADRAAAAANQAAANKALAEGEKIMAQGEADAIRAPAEAVARAADRQSLVMMYYGFLTPVAIGVAIGVAIVLAIVAGVCLGIIVSPGLRVWLKMRNVEY